MIAPNRSRPALPGAASGGAGSLAPVAQRRGGSPLHTGRPLARRAVCAVRRQPTLAGPRRHRPRGCDSFSRTPLPVIPSVTHIADLVDLRRGRGLRLLPYRGRCWPGPTNRACRPMSRPPPGRWSRITLTARKEIAQIDRVRRTVKARIRWGRICRFWPSPPATGRTQAPAARRLHRVRGGLRAPAQGPGPAAATRAARAADVAGHTQLPADQP